MDKKKKAEKRDDKMPKTTPKPEEPIAREEEKPLDFGGLPERDLKKNLGCG